MKHRKSWHMLPQFIMFNFYGVERNLKEN
uniref:Uncharacterized protein n=1 Tax=Rhizophora mucronata TaxID=61149 RepID=A0A2P2QP61_RHIMU